MQITYEIIISYLLTVYVGNFLTSWVMFRFPRKTLLHGICSCKFGQLLGKHGHDRNNGDGFLSALNYSFFAIIQNVCHFYQVFFFAVFQQSW